MNRTTNILSPGPPAELSTSPRSVSQTSPAITTQRVAQQCT
jgi:hypothetical protein